MVNTSWLSRAKLPFIILTIILFPILFQGQISITDIDAISYIEGAYSLQQRGQYVSLVGDYLNHWPPGYSLLLASFPEPITAAFVLNTFCLGVTVTLLWIFSKKMGWPPIPRTGFILAIGAGFLREISLAAKPDILAYTLFFVSTILFLNSAFRIH
jgi:hypothetical protein